MANRGASSETAPERGRDHVLRSSRSRTERVIAVSMVWTGWTCWAAWHHLGALSDDAFITLHYARNVAAGHGLVFNVGERVFGCTEPLLALLFGALAVVVPWPLTYLATIVHAASLLGLALTVLFATERRSILPEVVAGSLLLGLPYFWMVQGFAWPLVALLLALAASSWRRHPTLAGLVAGLAVGFRPDALIGLALLVALASVEAVRRRQVHTLPWHLIGASMFVCGALALAAWWWFGELLPTTLAAKQAFVAGSSRAAVRSGIGFWVAAMPTLERSFGDSTRVVLLIGLAGSAKLVAWRQLPANPVSQLLAGTGLLLAVAYPLLGVAYWPWYVALPLVGVVCGLGEMLHWQTRKPFLVIAIGLFALWLLATTGIAATWSTPRRVGPRVDLYREVGHWLATETSIGTRVAAFEVGTLAFYSNRPMDDLLGLVSPGFAPLLASGDRKLLAASRAQLLVLTTGHLDIAAGRWFERRYEPLRRFGQGTDEAVIYRRRARGNGR